MKFTYVALIAIFMISYPAVAAPGADKIRAEMAALQAQLSTANTDKAEQKANCDKAYRAISGNAAADEQDCAALEAEYNKLHKIIYGSDFKLGGADRSANTDEAALGAVEKLEQIHRVTAEYLAKIVWRVLEKLRPDGAAANNYSWDGAAGAANHDLSGEAGWRSLINSDLANAAGAAAAAAGGRNANLRRHIMVTMWVLDCFNDAAALATLGRVTLAGGAFTQDDLAAAISKKLWTFDMAMLAKILYPSYSGAAAGGIVNLNQFDDGRAGALAIRAHAHGGPPRTGELTMPPIDYLRVIAALNKLMGR